MKSSLAEKINKLLWTGEISEYMFLIENRGSPENEKTIHGENITALKDRFLVLKNGTMVPIQRIKEIRKI